MAPDSPGTSAKAGILANLKLLSVLNRVELDVLASEGSVAFAVKKQLPLVSHIFDGQADFNNASGLPALGSASGRIGSRLQILPSL